MVVGGQCHIISQQTNSKQEEHKDQACFQDFANFLLGTDGCCSMAGLAFSLPPDFLILIITTELRQSKLQSQNIKYHTKQRIV